MTKAEVRTAARDRGLVTADKPESQEICFVPTGDYRDLLRTRMAPTHDAFQPGPIVTTDGKEVGTHDGYAGFTVGQRKGLPGGFPEAMFVVAVRPDTRQVVVGPRDHMFAGQVELQGLNWLTDPLSPGAELQVQLRHRAAACSARIDSVEGGSMALSLAEPQFAVTPGQSGVLFSGGRVLGGGRISGSG